MSFRPVASVRADSTYTWLGGTANFQSTNWSGTADPLAYPSDANDSIIVSGGGSSTMTLTANTTTGGTHTFTGALDLTVNLAGFTWDALPLNNANISVTTITIGATAGDNTVVRLTSSAANGLFQNTNASTPSAAAEVTLLGLSNTGRGQLIVTNSAGFGPRVEQEGDLRIRSDTSNLTVTGSGSFYNLFRGTLFLERGSINVQNGGILSATALQLGTSSNTTTLDIDGAGSEFRIAGASGFLGRNGAVTIAITNGGKLRQTVVGNTTLGDTSASDPVRVTLSGAGSEFSVSSLYIAGSASAAAGDSTTPNSTYVEVNTGTTLRVENAAGAGIKVWDKGMVNVIGGTVELAAGTNLELVDSSAAATQPGRGLLRGYGTIQRYNASGSSFFTVLNTSGAIRPGDTTATPATGLLTINNGHLNHAVGGFLYLDIDSMTAYDRIRLVDTAVVAQTTTATLSGTLDYTLSGLFTPAAGFLDFVLAEDIVYAPLSDDLPTLLASLTLPAGMGYTYGVTTVGVGDYALGAYAGYEALRLTFYLIPEPTALAALGVGVIGLMGRRARTPSRPVIRL